MPRANSIVIGENVYQMSRSYIAGAKAMRGSTSWHANPHREGSQRHEDWNFGHVHEAAGEHLRHGLDLLAEVAQGREFCEDPCVPRDGNGEVDPRWYQAAFSARTGLAA